MPSVASRCSNAKCRRGAYHRPGGLFPSLACCGSTLALATCQASCVDGDSEGPLQRLAKDALAFHPLHPRHPGTCTPFKLPAPYTTVLDYCESMRNVPKE